MVRYILTSLNGVPGLHDPCPLPYLNCDTYSFCHRAEDATHFEKPADAMRQLFATLQCMDDDDRYDILQCPVMVIPFRITEKTVVTVEPLERIS